jgi:hypothetical protein
LAQLFRNHRTEVLETLVGPESGFVIQFHLISNEGARSIHRIATLALQREEGAPRFAATVATAEEIQHLQRRIVAAPLPPAVEVGPLERGALQARDPGVFELRAYPIFNKGINLDRSVALALLAPTGSIPEAWKIFQVMRKIFDQGVPLPAVEGFSHASIHVVYSPAPGKAVQNIEYYHGDRNVPGRQPTGRSLGETVLGQMEPQQDRGLATGVQCGGGMIPDLYETLLAEARGEKRPTRLPPHAVIVHEQGIDGEVRLAPPSERPAIDPPR